MIPDLTLNILHHTSQEALESAAHARTEEMDQLTSAHNSVLISLTDVRLRESDLQSKVCALVRLRARGGATERARTRARDVYIYIHCFCESACERKSESA